MKWIFFLYISAHINPYTYTCKHFQNLYCCSVENNILAVDPLYGKLLSFMIFQFSFISMDSQCHKLSVILWLTLWKHFCFAWLPYHNNNDKIEMENIGICRKCISQQHAANVEKRRMVRPKPMMWCRIEWKQWKKNNEYFFLLFVRFVPFFFTHIGLLTVPMSAHVL